MVEREQADKENGGEGATKPQIRTISLTGSPSDLHIHTSCPHLNVMNTNAERRTLASDRL